jgi:hypothetical protein
MDRLAKKVPKPENCLNCGEKITGSYCSNCGQKNTSYRESIWYVVSDLLEEAFSFDSRLYRSVYLLLLKPGVMTREYNEGKRVKYIRPLRIYLFSSIVYFFILSLIRPVFLDFKHGISEMEVETASDAVASIIDSVSVAGVDAVGMGEETPDTENVHIITLDEFTSGLMQEELGDTLKNIQIIGMDFEEWDSLVQDWKADQEAMTDNFLVRVGKEYTIAQFEKLKGMTNEELERSFLNAFQKNLPTMVFFLLPVFAVILKILYPLSKRFYIEHLIFSLHFHSFVFLVLTILLLIDKSDFYGALPVVTIIYLFQAMRTAYAQSLLRTLGKLFLLLLFYWLSLALVFASAVLLTFVFM